MTAALLDTRPIGGALGVGSAFGVGSGQAFGVGVGAMSSAQAAALSDDALIERQRELGEARRRIDAESAIVAAEIKHRSRRELGYDGLAQSRGVRTPEALVQQVTGLSGRDAQALVRVGTLLAAHDLPERPASTPWLEPVAHAVADARVGVDAASVIGAGLGEPSLSVSADQLRGAAQQLALEAEQLTVERLAARARELRTDLDEAGIADREQERRDRRYLTLTPQPDGMTRIAGLLDPESAAIVVGAVDAITAPRRGGPRFVDAADLARAEGLEKDERSIPQITADALVDMIRVATLADDGTLFGSHRVGVRVMVTERDLDRGTGPARIEGQPDAVSVATAERHACDAGIVPVLFDTDGRVLNLGRTQRTFSARQRVALAVRDGGCIAEGCDRPPAWCEAHHIDEWLRHGGRTDLADGVLLCRHHHLLVHNRGWRVVRDGTSYRMQRPPGDGAHDTPLPSKNPLLGRVLART
jgi:hypothetical protein